MKKTISVILIVASILCLFSGCGKKYDLTNYKDVLKLCCEAINENDKKTIKLVIYDKLGSSWNLEHIYDVMDVFYDPSEEVDDGKTYNACLPLIAESYYIENEYKSTYNIKKAKDWIYEETGCFVDVEEMLELGLRNDSYIEIALIKTDGRWYVLYFDL